MRVYTGLGYTLIAGYAVVSAALAPPDLGPWGGLAVGGAYLVVIWLLSGVYIADILHVGIAHGALHFRPGFIKTVAVVNSAVGIYVDPVGWVNRHRHHHEFSDGPGDPNKRAEDGFWKTLYLCLSPYPCAENFARDRILQRGVLRVVAQPWFAAAAQVVSYAVIWAVVRDWRYALALWAGVRVVGLWVNMIQNYWAHDRRFGTRRYDDPHDDAVNISDWLPVTATFSACWQNNHHHHPHLLRMTHDGHDYDFGFMTVRAMKALGLVTASAIGQRIPAGVALEDVGL